MRPVVIGVLFAGLTALFNTTIALLVIRRDERKASARPR